MRNVLVLILTLAVIALVIIGLINFDLLLTITGNLTVCMTQILVNTPQTTIFSG